MPNAFSEVLTVLALLIISTPMAWADGETRIQPPAEVPAQSGSGWNGSALSPATTESSLSTSASKSASTTTSATVTTSVSSGTTSGAASEPACASAFVKDSRNEIPINIGHERATFNAPTSPFSEQLPEVKKQHGKDPVKALGRAFVHTSNFVGFPPGFDHGPNNVLSKDVKEAEDLALQEHAEKLAPQPTAIVWPQTSPAK